MKSHGWVCSDCAGYNLPAPQMEQKKSVSEGPCSPILHCLCNVSHCLFKQINESGDLLHSLCHTGNRKWKINNSAVE